MKEVAKGQMSLLGFIDKPSTSTSTSSTLPELKCGCNDTDMQKATNANAMLMNEGNFNALEEEFILIPIESNCNFHFDTFSNDPADWKSSEELISYFVEKEYIPQNVEFDNAEFINSTVQVIGNKQRFLTKPMFKRKMINGEEVDRTWLIFSLKTKMLYCGVCKLFSPTSIEC